MKILEGLVKESSVQITLTSIDGRWFADFVVDGVLWDADGEGETPEEALGQLLVVVEGGGYG